MEKLTISDLEKMDKTFLSPKEVSIVLECNRMNFTNTVKQNRTAYGFPTIKCGKRIKIPRVPFIRFMKGETVIEERISLHWNDN